MNKRFATAAVVAAAAMLLSGCSSDESPSELDMLIEQLQTVQLTSETTPEEAPEDTEGESESTEEPVTGEGTEEISEETADSENTEAPSEDTEALPEDTDPSESTEETTDNSEENENNPIAYKSLTVTVVSIEEDHIMVELDGVVYKAFIDESTGIFGGEITEGKTVTITYVLNDDNSEANISAAAITVLP